MSNPNMLKQIGSLIHDSLEKGFVLDGGAVHFLDSTYAVCDSEDLGTLIAQGDENDVETVLDLVISPDRSFMNDVESLLLWHAFTPEDETWLIQAFSNRNLTTTLSFPLNNRAMESVIPDDVLIRFIKKLKLTFTFPGPLFLAMESFLSESLIPSVRVVIRHSGISLTDSMIEFLSLFFRYCSDDPKTFVPDLEWVLTILGGSQSQKPIQERLIDCFHDYQKRVEELKTIDEMLSKNTMETLMLQGVRVPSISADTLRSHLKTVRRILASVYAWVEGTKMQPSSVDIGDCVGKNGMKKILNLLS